LASLPEAICLSVRRTTGEQHTGTSLGLTETIIVIQASHNLHFATISSLSDVIGLAIRGRGTAFDIEHIK
jgi:hypothetical protein